MENWISVKEVLPMPTFEKAYDVTIQTPDGTRLLNVAMLPKLGEWQLLIDKHNYQDCIVIAWKLRTPPYKD